MYLASLHVSDFRNIAEIQIALSPSINLLVGENGAGKTALLEAVHLLARGRSFRTPQSKPLIRRGQHQLLVRGEVKLDSVSHKLARTKSVSGENQTRIDGQHASKQSRYAQLLPLQTLLPGVSDLVLDGPAVRREFIDWGLFHVEHNYLEVARRYRKALLQRSAWLKRDEAINFEGDHWVAELTVGGAKISAWREQFVDALNIRAADIMGRLDAGFCFELVYQGAGFSSIEADVFSQLSKSFERDRRNGTTHLGPHRAEMEIMVKGEPAKSVVSRGQAKLIASAIILAYSAELALRSELQPVLLLDDFGAELDDLHRERFFHELEKIGCQVIATTTDRPEYLVGASMAERATVFHVEQGSVGHY